MTFQLGVRPCDPRGQQRSRSCLSLGWHQWYLVTEFCFGDIFTSMKAGIILSLNSFVIYLQELNIDTVYQVIILNLIGSVYFFQQIYHKSVHFCGKLLTIWAWWRMTCFQIWKPVPGKITATYLMQPGKSEKKYLPVVDYLSAVSR